MAELTSEDRETLLDELAAFTRSDPKPFVSGPIVEPSEAWFAEPFAPTADGLEVIAAHLLAYVGLDGFLADVTVDETAVDESAMLPDTRTDLAGIEGRTVFFSCTQLGRGDDATYALAHEVARAALLRRRLRAGASPYREMESTELVEPDDTDRERYEASVFASYLGLGVLSASGSHHYRQAGRTQGRSQITAWQHVAYGGLSPEATSYLLAVQLVARGIDGERRERLIDSLPEERRLEVRSEIGPLDREALVARLGLPPPSEWPEEQSAPPPLARTPKKTQRAKKKRQPPGPVFRVRSDRRISGCGVGGVGTVVAGLLVHGYVFPFANASFPLLVASVAGAAGGLWLGAQSGWDDCSDCEHTIPADATHCPSCTGLVAGRIARRDQRLAARETWQAEQRAKALRGSA